MKKQRAGKKKQWAGMKKCHSSAVRRVSETAGHIRKRSSQLHSGGVFAKHQHCNTISECPPAQTQASHVSEAVDKSQSAASLWESLCKALQHRHWVSLSSAQALQLVFAKTGWYPSRHITGESQPSKGVHDRTLSWGARAFRALSARPSSHSTRDMRLSSPSHMCPPNPDSSMCPPNPDSSQTPLAVPPLA